MTRKVKSAPKLNIIDMLLIFLVLAVAIYAAVRAVDHFFPGESINNTVEVTLTLTDNAEYASRFEKGDELYVSGCKSALGVLKAVNYSAETQACTLVVETGFDYEAPVYMLEETLIARGGEYTVHTDTLSAPALCTGIRITSKATYNENVDGQSESEDANGAN